MSLFQKKRQVAPSFGGKVELSGDTQQPVSMYEVFTEHHLYFCAVGWMSQRRTQLKVYARIVLVLSVCFSALAVQSLMYRALLGVSKECGSVEMRSSKVCSTYADGFSNGGTVGNLICCTSLVAFV